jgi:hypothetical protein
MDIKVIEDLPELYKELEPYITYMESLDIAPYYTPMSNYFKNGVRDNYRFFNTWKIKPSEIISQSAIDRIKSISPGFNFFPLRDVYIADLVSGKTLKPLIEVYIYKVKKQKISADIEIWDIDNPKDSSKKYLSVIVDNFNDFKTAVDKTMNTYKKVLIHNRELDIKSVDV